MNELTAKKDPAVLAIEIRNLQQQAQVVVLSYAIEIGRRLCEAKAVLDHGQWGPWLEEQVEFSQSTANNYMKIFERYGSEQLSLFGDAKSQTLGNLPYTKALRLLAVPEDEVETFMEEHDVEHMSTRELEQAIRERDEAIADLTKEREAGVTLAIKADNLKAAAESARAEADKLREQIRQLEARPVEVAVEAPTEEMYEQIRRELEQSYAAEKEKLQKELEKAEKKAETAGGKVKKLQEQADKAREAAKTELQKDISAAEAAKAKAEAARADAEARAKALEDRLKTADGDTAVFKVYFTGVQEDLNRMLGMIQKAKPEQKEKYKAALRALLDSVGGAL